MHQRKINIIAYTLIFVCQLLMLPTFAFLNGSVFMLAVLLLFFGTTASFAWVSHALLHKINDLAAFAHSTLPYCFRLAVIALFDLLLFCFIRKNVDYAVLWLTFSLATLLLSCAVIFAVGAARTVLFKDR